MDQLKAIAEAALLGLIQGLTEFLPVSSSGHLELAKHILGYEAPLLFTVLLHLGTLGAVFLAFRRKIGALLAALFRIIFRRKKEGDDELGRLWVLLLVSTAATVPLVIVFSMLNDYVNAHPKLIGVCFLITAAVLVATIFFKAVSGRDRPGIGGAVAIGALQGVAVLSGVSRSGMTVGAGLAAGLDRAKAAEYSFLLAIPAILGGFLWELKDAPRTLESVSVGGLIAGVVTAFLTGLAAILLLVKLIKIGKFWLFALYLAPLGVLTIIFA
jgi:undecaprenyl-diphosphatase